jgi:hypothetical protein
LFGCGPAEQFTVAKNLGSATFSGTVTALDLISGEEKTLTVNGELTATGRIEVSGGTSHFNSESITIVSHFTGKGRQATGSLTISGDGISFSTEDATGTIGFARSGLIEVDKT